MVCKYAHKKKRLVKNHLLNLYLVFIMVCKYVNTNVKNQLHEKIMKTKDKRKPNKVKELTVDGE